MSARKTPVLLRRGPVTGRIYALTRYTRHDDGDVTAHDKQDVSVDFDALVLEELISSHAPHIIAILETIADGDPLTDAEREQVGAFRARLHAMAARHNARIEETTA